ncbi:MAG TPA: ABC transporter ATP-binding protein [Bacteroidetes bacterium]|nr:ABC transporter ATP-binding protein [Bacteroidota bacterium]HRK03813.1 ABC transporter ATP-binding protein [Chlorobiota bacterium]
MAETPRQGGALRELRRLLPYLRRYRSLVLLGITFITISNICSTLIPRVVGRTIDTLRVETFTQENVLALIGEILLLTIGSGFFMFATRRTIIVASRRVEEDLRNDFVNALQSQSQKFFHDRSTGGIIALFTNDIGAVREFIGPAVMYSANTITTFAFALSFMVSLNGWLTLAIVIPVPFIAYSTYKLGRKIHEQYKRVQEQYEHITTHAQETFSGVRVVRAYAREESEDMTFADESRTYYGRNMKLARYNALMMPAMTVLFNISYVIVIGFGGWLIVKDMLTVGMLTQFFIYLNQLLWPIAAIGWVTGMIQRGAASMARLGAIIEHVPEIRDTEFTNMSIKELKGSVSFSNVTLAYPTTTSDGIGTMTTVLHNIDLNIPAGTSLGIVGHVGAGKTSLVNLIPRLYDVTDGSVRIDGHDVRTIPLGVLRDAIAVVPQESFLFSDTIRENVRFGNPDATDEDVLRASSLAQLDGDIVNLPQGYDTVVGERGITLSGGQKQRTALARAILDDPAVLILDDSLSAVDTDTESRILRGLETVKHGRTTIIIAHRVSAVKDCDRIIVLKDGKIIESGSHNELLTLGGTYADLHERQLLEAAIQ